MKEKKLPCAICGSTSYEWGTIRSQGIKYFPEDTGWVKKQFSLGIDMKARRCTQCNNIQIFAE